MIIDFSGDVSVACILLFVTLSCGLTTFMFKLFQLCHSKSNVVLVNKPKNKVIVGANEGETRIPLDMIV